MRRSCTTSRLAEGIALHMNVRVRVTQGVEAHLLNAGAALDGVGLRLAELSPEVGTPRTTVSRRRTGRIRISPAYSAVTAGAEASQGLLTRSLTGILNHAATKPA